MQAYQEQLARQNRELREKERQLKILEDISLVGIFRADIQGLYSFVNQRWCEIAGLSEDQARGRGWVKALHSEDRDRVLAEWRQAAERKARFKSEYRLQRPAGVTAWVVGQAEPEIAEDGGFTGYTGTLIDITEHKRETDSAIREAEQKYRGIFENAVEGIFRTTPEGRYCLANPALARTLGYESSDELISSVTDIGRQLCVNPGSRDQLRQLLAERGVVRGFESQLYRKDGTRIWVSVTAREVRDVNGALLYYEGFNEDITERKAAQEALQESEGKFRTIADTAPCIIFLHQGQNFAYMNPAAEAIFGYTQEEFRQLKFWEVIHPGFRDLVRERGLARQRGEPVPTRYTVKIVTKAGEGRWVDLAVGLTQWGGKPAVLGIAYDITERIRAEEALRESEARKGAILESALDAIVTIDHQGAVTEFNPAAERIFGYQRAEAVGRLMADLIVPPSMREAHRHDLERYQAAGEDVMVGRRIEIMARRADGAEFPAELAITRIPRDGPLAFTAYIRDITERKRWEEQIRRSNQKLKTLHDVTVAVGSSLELSEMFGTLKKLFVEQLGVPGGAIFFYDGEADRLHPEAAWGFPEELLDRFANLTASAFNIREVVHEKGTVLRTDFREIPSLVALGLGRYRPGWQSFLSVPLLARGEVHAVLALFSQAPHVFSQDQADFFTALGQEVGIAVQNARLFAEVRAGQERLQNLSRRLVEVQEAERRFIARELHDEIGQVLTGLKLTLERSSHMPTETVDARLAEARVLVNELISRVRELSLDLRPGMLDDLGLLPALLGQFERYTAQTGVRVRFAHDLRRERFPPELETAVFRIVQEALTNVARHAKVNEAIVRLWSNEQALVLQVNDEGAGFDPGAALRAGSSSGLIGMRERVVLLGGGLTVESAPNAGTCLAAEFPLIGKIEGTKENT